jgi:hypothetical protein
MLAREKFRIGQRVSVQQRSDRWGRPQPDREGTVARFSKIRHLQAVVYVRFEGRASPVPVHMDLVESRLSRAGEWTRRPK